jgi:hypothetical protein
MPAGPGKGIAGVMGLYGGDKTIQRKAGRAKLMCQLETFSGGCTGCPYETGETICRKGRLEIHRLCLRYLEEESPYDKKVIKLRKAIAKKEG